VDKSIKQKLHSQKNQNPLLEIEAASKDLLKIFVEKKASEELPSQSSKANKKSF
jgi:hypothetical protein